ncbi:hypothetical protein J437_LFUL010766 [Ladona fulva]|uniref:CHCH domain-containing protein n=1 Tax=Ladona fulva TaxID=123851 RepID=A0A8K0P4K0_LADFU|nr:hypothetical protein J437_LFUL010766 [Ladona fulva]
MLSVGFKMPRQRRSSPAPRSSVPARAPPQQPVQHAAQPPVIVQEQPSMFKQMAATAGGVAVGSAVGHTLGHAMTGLFSGGGSDAPAAQAAAPAAAQPYASPAQNQADPCAFATKQFLECAQQQSDLSLCQGFSEALRQCKLDYRLAA